MPKMSAFEAKSGFGELLHRVERGEEIVITRHDRTIARVVREVAPNLDSVRRSVEGLRRLAAANSQTQPRQVRTLAGRVPRRNPTRPKVKRSFVADASVAIAWVHPAQASAETDALLDRLAAGDSLVVPALWPLAVANAQSLRR